LAFVAKASRLLRRAEILPVTGSARLGVLGGAFALAAVLTGCQTVQGVGKDLSYAGEKTASLFEGGDDDQPRTLPQN